MLIHIIDLDLWMTLIEKVNLLLIGLASRSYKTAVGSDIPVHDQFIQAESLKTKEYIKNKGLDNKENLRKFEKNEVKYAKTNILKNKSIPYIYKES